MQVVGFAGIQGVPLDRTVAQVGFLYRDCCVFVMLYAHLKVTIKLLAIQVHALVIDMTCRHSWGRCTLPSSSYLF